MYLAMNLLKPVPIACSATITKLMPNQVQFVIIRNMYFGNSVINGKIIQIQFNIIALDSQENLRSLLCIQGSFFFFNWLKLQSIDWHWDQ